MDRKTIALRRKAIKALEEAVGEMTPTQMQSYLSDWISADVNRAFRHTGRGAGQSTARLMLALRILKEDLV